MFSKPILLPANFRALDTKMVLREKESGSLALSNKLKARLCVKGYKQEYGIDYFETYSPVACQNALRIFITIMIHLNYEMDTVDVITAFLLADLKEEIYIKLPEGYPAKPQDKGKVLRLLKALYGTKQAPYSWNQTIDGYLKSLKFTAITSDRCIYVGWFKNIKCYLLLYVDDMIIASPNRSVMQSLKNIIHQKFPIRDNGPLKFFLNMHFDRDWDNKCIYIHQSTKIENIIKEFNITGHKQIPADPNIMLSKDMCPTDPLELQYMSKYPYKRAVGLLLYISLTSRPDIATAVSAVGRYAANPGRPHWNAVLHIMEYLNHTKEFHLKMGGKDNNLVLQAYSDADWAGETDQRKSRTGLCVFLGKSCVMWCSKLQTSIALSSMSAEYVALAATCVEVIWARSFLHEIGQIQNGPTTIYEDNKSCIDVASNGKQHPGLKAVDIRHHFVQERVIVKKDITLEKKSTTVMTADLFTKQLARNAFQRHRASLGLIKRK